MKKEAYNTWDRKRDKELSALRERGATFTALGKKYGISNQRARALYLREEFERSGEK